jgi:Putative auto-transporter adhesin, head GIN domain
MLNCARLGLVALAAAALGCRPYVSGNGVLGTRPCLVAAFSRVSVGLGIDARITVSDPEQPVSCVLSGDENLVENFAFSTTNGQLEVAAGGLDSFDRILPLTLVISTPELLGVEAHDDLSKTAWHADVRVAGAKAQDFDATATGATQITLAAATGFTGATLTATLADQAKLFADAYPVGAATVAMSGRSQAQVASSGPVTGTATDASTLAIEGGGTCQVSLSGAASCTAP